MSKNDGKSKPVEERIDVLMDFREKVLGWIGLLGLASVGTLSFIGYVLHVANSVERDIDMKITKVIEVRTKGFDTLLKDKTDNSLKAFNKDVADRRKEEKDKPALFVQSGMQVFNDPQTLGSRTTCGGDRSEMHTIRYNVTLDEKSVQVAASFAHLDVNNDKPLRVKIKVVSAGSDSTVIQVSTWCDTQVVEADVQYTISGRPI